MVSRSGVTESPKNYLMAFSCLVRSVWLPGWMLGQRDGSERLRSQRTPYLDEKHGNLTSQHAGKECATARSQSLVAPPRTRAARRLRAHQRQVPRHLPTSRNAEIDFSDSSDCARTDCSRRRLQWHGPAPQPDVGKIGATARALPLVCPNVLRHPAHAIRPSPIFAQHHRRAEASLQ